MGDYYLDEQLREVEIVPEPGDRRPRQIFLDAARALMLCGALAVVCTVGNGNPAASNGTHVFIGFLAWILGVSILALLPVARRFPPAVVVGIALASSLFKYLFAPMELA